MTLFNEIEPFACDWLASLFPSAAIDRRSIKELSPDDLNAHTRCHLFSGIGGWELALQEAGWPEECQIWTGSCPCQPFSNAGKRKGTADERHLWPDFFRLINACRPSCVMGEQVASKDGLAWLDGVQADLESAGYSCWAVDSCAAGVNSPHIRQRLYWVAYAAESRHARTGPGPAANGNRENTLPQRGFSQPKSSRSGEIDRLEYAPSVGREQGWAESNGRSIASGRGIDRLGHSSSARPQERIVQPGISGRAGLSVAWETFDVASCRDGKSRRISAKSGVFRMVDGISGEMGCDEPRVPGMVADSITNSERGFIDAAETKASTSTELQALRGPDGETEIQRTTGRLRGVQEESLLQPGVHGEWNGGCYQGNEQPQLASPISQDGEGNVREVRSEWKDAARSPQGRQWTEQQRVEFNHIVRSMSPSLAFAKLYGRRDEAKALQDLREAIREEGALHQASAATEEVWQSLSNESKKRIGICFSGRACIVFPSEPLAFGLPREVGSLLARLGELGVDSKTAKRIIALARRNRTGRLKGYGNAIVPQVAVEFIKAVMPELTGGSK